MNLYSCDGRKLENRHLSSFYCSSSSEKEPQQNDDHDDKFSPVSLPKDDVLKNCKMLSRIIDNTSNINNNAHDDEPSLDFRGISCASESSLVAFSIWIKEDISQCFVNYKKESREVSRENRLKGQEENPFLFQQQQQQEGVTNAAAAAGVGERDNNNILIHQLQENHSWEPVLYPRIPQRVSFDLISCFPTDAHKPTRKFLVWLLETMTWDDIAQLHLFSIFVGCGKLSKTIANLIALHVRQESMGLAKKMEVQKTEDDDDDDDDVEKKNKKPIPAGKENPELLIEDVRKRKKEMILTESSSSVGAAAAAVVSKPTTTTTTAKSSRSTSGDEVVENLGETVKWLKNELLQ